MHTLPKPESTEEAIKNTNPMYNTPYGKTNCASCVLAAHLRQQGYDVNAKVIGQNGLLVDTEYRSFIKNYDDVHVKEPFKSKADAESQILKMTNGKNGSGALSVTWKGQGGCGHIFNWKVENGNVIFYDVQPGGTEKVDFDKLFKKMAYDKRNTNFYRFDTADFDWTKLREYIYG